jgi:hypothetical protein
MTIHSATQPRKRSKAWVYYTLLAVGSLIAAFSHPIGLLGLVLFGLYAWYLYRGGQFVLWFW